MKQHHTKDKGDLGVLKTAANLSSYGFVVLFTPSEHLPFDLVSYREGKFQRISVKYVKMSKSGSISVLFRSSWTDKKGRHSQQIDKKEVDLICIYCPDTDQCYYLNPSLYNRGITLRLKEAGNNQKSNVHFAKDFVCPYPNG